MAALGIMLILYLTCGGNEFVVKGDSVYLMDIVWACRDANMQFDILL